MFTEISRKEIKNELVQKLHEISGQDVFDCYQCGNCSSGCPVVDYMDINPNQVLRLAQYGKIQDILESETIWVCSTCLQCSSRCPKGIDVAKLMEAFRTINLRAGLGIVDPRKLDVENKDELPPILLVCAMRKLTG
ncbi:MAG: 4Fe-4S dicluster domain-containing protein [Candidatus Cloacimonetes bacterium]|nr:4Fe-4S dicluster domain-containing protein [Candidatus Cloacimonadota bacterium]MCF7813447.1 4Fe-4S dicluster domain-containing protein [Candidatus Cloacimonadota bacterium]MCF7867740.1 4Fe-4S dicluster domain-containing protein [Candidatus Cloacimonadota bacterium]MCF7883174.1 4Fe-4S dicluster domain-containing protein [Candidatus Cloacimonadota bacterium]